LRDPVVDLVCEPQGLADQPPGGGVRTGQVLRDRGHGERSSAGPRSGRQGPSRAASGSAGGGRTAGRIVTRPAAALTLSLTAFGGLAAVALWYTPAGFGAAPGAPRGSDSAAGNALLAAHFPAASSNPTNVLLRLPAPAWAQPAPVARAERLLAAAPAVPRLTGPLDVNGVMLTAGQLFVLHAKLGDSRALAPAPPPGSGIRPAIWAAYRAESQFISPVSIVVIAILLALVLRSLVATVYLIASVAISYLVAFGLSVLLFEFVAGSGGLNYFIPHSPQKARNHAIRNFRRA
jgi:RND superfamily putative drug exporter